MHKTKLIVFDMDGVIVDVSRSYRDTVRMTAKLFFQGAQSQTALPDPLFSLADLARVKQAGGLNNDWELTYHVLRLLLTKIEVPDAEPDREAWKLLKHLMPRCDVSALSRYLKSEKTPLESLHEQYPNPRDALVETLSSGDVGSGNIIKQIFQEVYLGGKLFKKTYNLEPQKHVTEGLIDREKRLLPLSFFSDLSKQHLLAIATGRPKAEAYHALTHFGLQSFFKMVCCLEDCLEEEQTIFKTTGEKVSLSKPDPYMLDKIGSEFSNQASQRFYIGDMPDDMMAAAASLYGYHGIGTLFAAPDRKGTRKILVEAGARDIAENEDELMDLIGGPDNR